MNILKIVFIWITFRQEKVLDSTKDMGDRISYSPTLNVFASNWQKYEVTSQDRSFYCR